MENIYSNCQYLALGLERLEFNILSKFSYDQGLPVIAFRMNPAKIHHFDEFDVSEKLLESRVAFFLTIVGRSCL